MQKGTRPSSSVLNILIPILGALILILGVWGSNELHHELHPAEPVTFGSIIVWIYDSLKIALFHGHTDHLNWQINTAVALALIESLAVTVWGAVTIFPEHIARMAFPFRKGHAVVCGLNRRALQLALDLRRDNYTVAVIEKNAANPLIESCHHHGILTFIGDATDRAMLRDARIHAASHVIAFTSTDSVNVDIAAAADHRMKAHPARKHPLKCHVHIVDFALLTWLRRNDLMAARERRHIHVRMFDCFEISARLLLRDFPLDRDPLHPILSPEDPRQVHLVIAGFGHMGEALALEAAKQCHFANLKKPRITMIDRHARHLQNAFLNRFPQFGAVCDITFIEAETDDPVVIESFKQWSDEKNTLETIAVCFDSDSASLACALGVRRIAEPAGVPIRLRLSAKSGLSHLLSEVAEKDGTHFTPFGMLDDICRHQMVLDEELNRFARDVHHAYCTKVRPDKAVPWEHLDPDLRDSNVQQSQHTDIKLRTLGLEKSKKPLEGREPVSEFSTSQIELLATMEHARWNAERLLAGWTLDESLKEKDLKTKRTPFLLPWSRLGEDAKKWDREFVKDLPARLKHAGYTIYRKK